LETFRAISDNRVSSVDDVLHDSVPNNKFTLCQYRHKSHSWATHLLEASVNLQLIQAWLGHRNPAATSVSVYTHLTEKTNSMASKTIDELMDDL